MNSSARLETFRPDRAGSTICYETRGSKGGFVLGILDSYSLSEGDSTNPGGSAADYASFSGVARFTVCVGTTFLTQSPCETRLRLILWTR